MAICMTVCNVLPGACRQQGMECQDCSRDIAPLIFLMLTTMGDHPSCRHTWQGLAVCVAWLSHLFGPEQECVYSGATLQDTRMVWLSTRMSPRVDMCILNQPESHQGGSDHYHHVIVHVRCSARRPSYDQSCINRRDLPSAFQDRLDHCDAPLTASKTSALLQSCPHKLSLELTTVSNLDCVQGLVHPVCFHSLNFLDNVHALNNLPKHHMLSIQVSTWHCANEELTAIRARSCKQFQCSADGTLSEL